VTPLIEAADEVPAAPEPGQVTVIVEATQKIFISGLYLAGIRLTQWTLRRITFPRLADGDTEIDSYWEHKEDPAATARLRIEIRNAIQDAQDQAVRRLLHSAGFPLEPGKPVRLPAKGPDDVVFVTAIGNLYITCQNVGFADRSLNRLHEELRDLFAGTPPGDVPPTVVDSPYRTDFRIDLKSRDGLVWFKLVTSPKGNLFSLGKEVYFTPGPGRRHRVDVYEMSGSESVGHYAWEFRVPEA
jgi:hypothetical protein